MDPEIALFELASYLTDPICNARESLIQAAVVDSVYTQASVIELFARKVFLWMSALFFATLALFTTLPGIAIRGCAAWMQTNSYTVETADLGKELPPDRSFTLFSWNICCVPGGYSITDGDVFPWKERIDAIVDKVLEKDGDVNCFYELFDFHAAQYLKEKLKTAGYPHFFYNIGPLSLGVSSGFLIASKYKLENARFDPFPTAVLPGRSRFANKGVFGFDLVSSNTVFSRVYALHLSHSELPEFPTEEEVNARREQMQFVMNEVPLPQDRSLIFTGDFNMDLPEYESSPWRRPFIRAESQEAPTWGGDAFCAALSEKQASAPLTLDYTAFWEGTAQRIETEIVQTGYFADQYSREALSDHAGLFSRIQLLPVS